MRWGGGGGTVPVLYVHGDLSGYLPDLDRSLCTCSEYFDLPEPGYTFRVSGQEIVGLAERFPRHATR